jgi:hypothetical protein
MYENISEKEKTRNFTENLFQTQWKTAEEDFCPA